MELEEGLCEAGRTGLTGYLVTGRSFRFKGFSFWGPHFLVVSLEGDQLHPLENNGTTLFPRAYMEVCHTKIIKPLCLDTTQNFCMVYNRSWIEPIVICTSMALLREN